MQRGEIGNMQNSTRKPLRNTLDRIAFYCVLLIGLPGAVVSGSAVAQEEYQANEYEIKAAYLLNFPNFVEWPDSGSSENQSPIRLCLLGTDPLGNSLSRMIADRLSRGRSVPLRQIGRTDSFSTCQILYISASEGKYIPQILDSLHGASILTVGENDQFAEQGGMIQLVMQDNRIRFKINPTAAAQAGIRISSKLLALAQIVTPVRPTQTANRQATFKQESLKKWGAHAPYCWTVKRTGSISIPLPT